MRKSANNTYTETTIWTPANEGDSIEGRYTGSETFIGKFGEATKYVIEFEGTAYGVYGTASINRQFNNIPEGSYVWITYKGIEPTKNGRNVKVFDIDYDTEA